MPTYRLDISYDGTGFHGYASQEGVRTVQGVLEASICSVLRSDVAATSVSGRTDAGVHARGQVVSLAVDEELDERRLLRSLNGLVGPEIAANSVVRVDDDFDARFCARSRTYRYRIATGTAPNPLARFSEWHVSLTLDLEGMSRAAAQFIGEHDFGSFCRSVEGKSGVRRVERSEWVAGESRLDYWVTANAFCHQMVRSMVGFMYDVGRGFASSSETANVIRQKDRRAVATVAPPHGLTLWEVSF